MVVVTPVGILIVLVVVVVVVVGGVGVGGVLRLSFSCGVFDPRQFVPESNRNLGETQRFLLVSGRRQKPNKITVKLFGNCTVPVGVNPGKLLELLEMVCFVFESGKLALGFDPAVGIHFGVVAACLSVRFGFCIGFGFEFS